MPRLWIDRWSDRRDTIKQNRSFDTYSTRSSWLVTGRQLPFSCFQLPYGFVFLPLRCSFFYSLLLLFLFFPFVPLFKHRSRCTLIPDSFHYEICLLRRTIASSIIYIRLRIAEVALFSIIFHHSVLSGNIVVWHKIRRYCQILDSGFISESSCVGNVKIEKVYKYIDRNKFLNENFLF